MVLLFAQSLMRNVQIGSFDLLHRLILRKKSEKSRFRSVVRNRPKVGSSKNDLDRPKTTDSEHYNQSNVESSLLCLKV